jgi:hypothetical protein
MKGLVQLDEFSVFCQMLIVLLRLRINDLRGCQRINRQPYAVLKLPLQAKWFRDKLTIRIQRVCAIIIRRETMTYTPIVPASVVISVVKDSVDIPKVLSAYWEKGYDIAPVIQSDEGKVMFDISKPGALWISVEEVVSQAPWGEDVQGVAEFYGGISFGPVRTTAYSQFQTMLRARVAFVFQGTKLTDLLD